jgi:Mor family transcriptional regulator
MLNESEKRLLSVDGFIEAVENKLHETQSFKRAWEQTEEEYKDLIGHYRYSTYENFRSIKSRKKKQRRHRRLI